MGKSIQAARVHKALETIRDAEEELFTVVRDEYPVGSRIAWEIRRSAYAGEGSVLGIRCDGSGIKVHNDATGKDYWIPVSRVL